MSNKMTTLPELFYTINLSLSIICSALTVLFGCFIIFTTLIHKPFRTIANLLTCNSGLCVIVFEMTMFTSSIFGLRNDWLYYQPACRCRAYFIVSFCAIIAYSYLIQAISRLFFIVFYQYKNLQTYRTHYILILSNWCIGILIVSIVYSIDNNAGVLIPQFRFCALSFDSLISSIFMGLSIFIIPFCFVLIIYSVIFIQIRRSKNRVQTINFKSNIKRELKLVKVTFIIWTCFACAGMPYFLLIIWKILFKTSAPEAFYLTSINLIIFNCGLALTLALFITDDLKKYVKVFLNLINH